MKSQEIEVLVIDGPVVVQRWLCARAMMPDGSDGVIWRGIAYRLLEGDRIDVSVQAATEVAVHYTLLPGEDASWVLVAGLAHELSRALLGLKASGIAVLRSGRWLGEPVGGVGFDWFICCDGPIDAAAVAAVLGSSPLPQADHMAARLTLLEQRVAELRADLAVARSSHVPVLSHPATIEADPAPCDPDPAADHALVNAVATIDALQAEVAALRRKPAPAGGAAATGRWQAELADMLAAFRPDVVLLRSSWRVALGEFQSRAVFWKAITELPEGGGRPEGWKPVQSVDRWWERHVSNGQDYTGRAYARFDQGARKWELLLSWKADQARDMDWLRKHS